MNNFNRILASLLGGTALLVSIPLLAASAHQDSQGPLQPVTKELEAAFAEQGIQLNLDQGLCAIPAQVCVREELLEYVLVASFGASHESLFATGVRPTVFNAALVTLGATKGTNVQWIDKDPMPTEEEIRNGASTHDVLPPTGEGFYVYVAWVEDGETYFFRLEDLITNIERGRSMRRHAWVYLGSRMIEAEPGEPEVLVAEMEGNLVNLSYFRAGNTIFTAALPDCVYQTIWVPNAPLIPEQGSEVTMVFSRQKLRGLPVALADGLAEVVK
ncbi:MAG: hypothetical protein ACI8X5_003422 [Planctomycetota bacterium]|jgi:hypothetical protein